LPARWRTFNVGEGDDRDAGAKRVVRGGSWNNNARNVRAAVRNRNHPDNRNNSLGFRCARAHLRTESGPEQIIIRGAAPAMPKPKDRRRASSHGGCQAKTRRPVAGGRQRPVLSPVPP